MEPSTKEKIAQCQKFPNSYDNCLYLLDYGYNTKDKNDRYRPYYDVDCRELGLPNNLQCAKRKMNWSDNQEGSEKQRKSIKKKYEPMIRRICHETEDSCKIRPYKDYCPCKENKMKLSDVPKKTTEFFSVLTSIFEDMGVNEAKKELTLKTKKFEPK